MTIFGLPKMLFPYVSLEHVIPPNHCSAEGTFPTHAVRKMHICVPRCVIHSLAKVAWLPSYDGLANILLDAVASDCLVVCHVYILLWPCWSLPPRLRSRLRAKCGGLRCVVLQ